MEKKINNKKASDGRKFNRKDENPQSEAFCMQGINETLKKSMHNKIRLAVTVFVGPFGFNRSQIRNHFCNIRITEDKDKYK